MEIWRKDLIQAITKKSKERDLNVTGDLIAFLLSLLLLNPDYYDEDGKIDTTHIIETIINLLICQSKPTLMTFKIQLHFVKHYQKRDEKIMKYRQRLRQKTEPLIKEICETKKITSDKDFQRLYQKILVVITLLSGLGKPTIPTILREVEVALQSVYQPSELPYFINLSNREKEEQLIELTCIVAGIRLFNKDCQRGGEGIDDLPSVLQSAVSKAELFILELLKELMQKIHKFTTAIEIIVPSFFEHNFNKYKLPEFITAEHILWIIDMLTVHRQQEIYIRKILADVEVCKNEIKCLLCRLQNQFIKLHDTVRYRTAIPTAQVYPQFVDLADTWLKLQDEVMVLSQINNFLSQLQSLCNTDDTFDDSVLDKIIGTVVLLTDAERLEQSMGKLITNCGKCSIVYPNTTKDFNKINLEFLGFCSWTFVIGKGALIPGNPNIGVAKWNGKYFAFSCSEAAHKFGRDPSRYLYDALEFILQKPEYIHLFQMYDEIMRMNSSNGDDSGLMTQRSQEIQTEVHILPSNFDKNYSCSIWEYRKKAIQLANICQSSTKSTQTTNTHFRSVTRIQIAPLKDKGVQTKKDSSTNTKKIITYISGLRGKSVDCPHYHFLNQ